MFRKRGKTDNQADKRHDPYGNVVNRDNAEGEIPKLEKGDLFAMLIAAFGVFLPALIIVSVILIGILWLLFVR